MSPSNYASQMTHKTCVARHLNNILIWWPYWNWPWPWPLLSIKSILIWYLLHSLGGLLAECGLTAFISPVSVADKARSDDFDFWPDMWHFKKICIKMLKKYSSRSFVCSLAHLATASRSWVRHRAVSAPPPPAGRFRPNTPAHYESDAGSGTPKLVYNV